MKNYYCSICKYLLRNADCTNFICTDCYRRESETYIKNKSEYEYQFKLLEDELKQREQEL